MTDSPHLGERLTALEPASAAARAAYEQELKLMLEQRVPAASRGLCLVLGLVCLTFAAAVSYAVFGDHEAYSYLPNIVLGVVLAGASLAVGVALLAVFVRGTYRREREGLWAASSGLLILATWGVFMLLAASAFSEHRLHGTFLVLGLVCLGAAAIVGQRLSAARAQLSIEKKLLELECRLAEISERLSGPAE